MSLLDPDRDSSTAPAAGGPPQVRPLWTIGIFLVSLLVYVVFTRQVLVYTNPPTGDQPFYLHTAISIVQDHDIEESNNYANLDEQQYYPRIKYPPDFKGILAPFPLPPHNGHTTNRPPNEQYSKHGLGLSVLIVPGWVLGTHIDPPGIDLTELDQPTGGWPMVVYQLNIIGALLAVQVFLLAYEATRRLPIALAVWVALAFSNPQMTYSYLIFPELPAGLCAVYAFRRLALGWDRNGPGRLLLIGLAAAFLPWLHARFLPITLGLMLFAVWSWWRARRPTPPAPVAPPAPAQAAHAAPAAARVQAWVPGPGPAPPAAAPRRPRWSGLSVLLPLLPVAISGLLLMYFYYWLYGTVLPNTGDHAGFIDPRSDPFGLPVAMLGLLFDQQWGLLIAAPVYLLAIVGLFALGGAPRKRALLLWLLILIGPYYLVVADYRQWWGEWCPPARYLMTITPLLALPLAQSLLALRRSVIYNVLYGALAVLGWLVMAGLLAHPRAFWNDPTGQSNLFAWINSQYHINLVPRFPAVVLWSWDHANPMHWELLGTWTAIAALVVVSGLILLHETRATINRRLAFRNYRSAPR